MEQSKLQELLNSLSKKEFEKIYLLRLTGIVNLRSEVKEFLELLHPNYKLAKKNSFSKEFLLELCSPLKSKTPFNQLANYITTYLLKAIPKLSKSRLEDDLNNLEFAANRNLTKSKSTLLLQIRKRLQQSNITSPQKHHFQYLLHDFLERHDKNIRNDKSHLLSMERHLDAEYVENKLKISCEKLNRHNLLNSSEALETPTVVLKMARQFYSDEYPSIKLYLDVYKMLAYPQERESHLKRIKQQLPPNQTNLSPITLNAVSELYINQLIRYLNVGRLKYQNDYFEISKWKMEEDLKRPSEPIDPFVFKNLMVSGIRLEKFDWAQDFIEEHKNRLPKESYDYIILYCKAYLEFSRNNIDKAFELISASSPKDLYHQVANDILLLKIYYKTNNFEAFEKLKDKLKQSVRKKKLIHSSKTVIIVRLINYLSMLKDGIFKSETLSRLKKKLLEEDYFPDKEWILKEIKQSALRQ